MHKSTRYARNLGGHGPLGLVFSGPLWPGERTPDRAYGSIDQIVFFKAD